MDATQFVLGQIIYYKTDPERTGIVTGIVYRPDSVVYMVTWDDMDEATHWACELSNQKLMVAST